MSSNMEQNNKPMNDVEIRGKEESRNRSSWGKRLSRPAVLLACAVLILLLVIIVIVLAAHLASARSGSHKTAANGDICQTPHCIKTASRLLGAMNTEYDPCDNFYQFACGRWVETHRVPQDKGSIDTMEEVSDRLETDLQDLLEADANDIQPVLKAKFFYRSCMDQASSQEQAKRELLKYIREVGGWPVLDPTWKDSTFDLEAALARARHYTTNYVWPIPHGILMGLNILNDFRIYGKHVIYFDQPSLQMEGRDMYLDPGSDVFPAYIRYVKDVAVALGADPAIAENQTRDMVKFETDIAKISVAVSDRRDMDTNYRRMNVSTLAEMYPQFDWLKYLRNTFTKAGVTINSDEPVILWMQQYYDKLFPLLQDTSKKTIANYITWRLITKQFAALENLNLMRLEFRKVTEGVKQLKPLGRRCADITNQYLDQATGRLYAEKNFGPKERAHMLDMISYLRRIFRDIIKTADWMDTKTKDYALRKLVKMKSLIGFPNLIFNNTLLTEYYEQISFTTDNFFENLRSIRKYVGLKQLSDLRKPSYEKWPERPAIVNAFYHSGLNAIVFPAGILQSPYYDIEYPASINFGGIGLVIGHEITHGYDASGRSFDEDGLVKNWWSDFSLRNFNNRATCVVDHYSNFVVPNINMTINGNNTLSENIADIGGVKQSHMAYKLWLKENNNKDTILPGLTQYSHEQLFFINTAQLWCSKFTNEAAKRSVLTGVHSLPMFRVLGELRNSHGFTEVFGCRRGSYMNPDQEKCSLW